MTRNLEKYHDSQFYRKKKWFPDQSECRCQSEKQLRDVGKLKFEKMVYVCFVLLLFIIYVCFQSQKKLRDLGRLAV